MLTHKLYQSGNSVAVTIPKQYLEELNLKKGSEVTLSLEGEDLVISPKPNGVAAGVDPNFMRMVDEFIEDHRDVLRELATK